MYKKAWVVPYDNEAIAIAYTKLDGEQGFMRLMKSGHPDLPALMRLLNAADRRKVEERISNVIPFNRSGR